MVLGIEVWASVPGNNTRDVTLIVSTELCVVKLTDALVAPVEKRVGSTVRWHCSTG